MTTLNQDPISVKPSMQMPNREAIRLWVEALRSNDYLQGRGQLHRVDMEGRDRYCCLGVACEVAIASGVPVSVTSPSDFAVKHYDGKLTSLPRSVNFWLGLPFPNPYLTFHDGNPIPAITANDYSHWSFEQIADALEATYLGDEVNGNT